MSSALSGCMKRRASAGLHLEDQVLPKRCGHLSGKALVDSATMASKIRAAVQGTPRCRLRDRGANRCP